MAARKKSQPSQHIENRALADLSNALRNSSRIDELEEDLEGAFEFLAMRLQRQTLAIVILGLWLGLLAIIALVLVAAAFFHWLVPVILGVLLFVLLLVIAFVGASILVPSNLLIDEEEEEPDDEPDHPHQP